MIIDESDAEVASARDALAAGYAGTSHKNCKGVIKGLANACLIASRRRADPAGTYHLSGEDLANVGPVALLQDLAVVATLGIDDVERNGHHYFRGLADLPVDLRVYTLEAHPDLYRKVTPDDGGVREFPAVDVRGGRIDIGSAVDAPFGTGVEFDPARFRPAAEWRWESLGPTGSR
jgi:hypothetical protein